MHSVAILGAGIGAQHADGYAALPETYRIHSICDLDTSRAAPVADRHGAGVFAEIETVLADPGVDIVDICLPPHLHFDIAMRALDAGKHVICEKPLVTSLDQADRLSARAQQTGRRVFPVFQYRYGLGTAQLFALIESGLTGRCFGGTLETHWDRDAAYYAIPWRGTWAGEQGGAVLGHAIHIHDLLTWILGPVARVSAHVSTRVNRIEVEDSAAIALTMEDGAPITSSISLGAAGNTSRLRLLFEAITVESNHAAYAPAAETWQFKARVPAIQAEIDTVLKRVSHPLSGFAGFFDAVASALAGAPNRAVTLADGRRSLELVSAIYHSARSGVAVDLPLDARHPLYTGWHP